jgi:TPR repeat protein
MKRLMSAGVLCVLCFCNTLPAMAETKAAASVQAIRSAASNGDAAAQLKLGEMYDLGQGVTQDYKEAVKWYRRAAEQGNAAARFALAEMYKNGDGVPQDVQAAIKWYRLAAGQDYALAQLLLGVLYESGTGVTANVSEATNWYRLAANSGEAHAQLLLADIYNAERGVARNLVAAYALYTVSAAREPRGNPANEHREQLAKEMTTVEIDRGTALAGEMAKPNNFLKALDQYLKNPN